MTINLKDLPIVPLDNADYWQNPYPILRELREKYRIVRTPQGMPALLHWADGVQAVGGTSHFIQEGVEFLERLGFKPGDPFHTHRSGAMGVLEGNAHVHVRSIVSAAMSKLRVQDLRPLICKLANELIDQKIESGRMEVNTDFALKLGKQVLMHHLGLEEEEWKLTMPPETASGLVDAFSPNAKLTQERIDRINQVVQGMMDNTEALYESRRKSPKGDLLSDIIAAEIEQGELPYAQRINLFSAIFGAGTSTGSILASGIMEFALHPDQAELLASDPEQWKFGACEESLRTHPAISQIGQKAARDTHVFDMDFKAGTPITVIVGAVNRDPARWEDPERFDIRRNAKEFGLTFGLGRHLCLGQNLARTTIQEGLAVFVQRCKDIELLEEPRWQPFAMENKFKSLHIGFRAA